MRKVLAKRNEKLVSFLSEKRRKEKLLQIKREKCKLKREKRLMEQKRVRLLNVLAHVPKNIWKYILTFVDEHTLFFVCPQVCRSWNEYVRDPAVFQPVFFQYWTLTTSQIKKFGKKAKWDVIKSQVPKYFKLYKNMVIMGSSNIVRQKCCKNSIYRRCSSCFALQTKWEKYHKIGKFDPKWLHWHENYRRTMQLQGYMLPYFGQTRDA